MRWPQDNFPKSLTPMEALVATWMRNIAAVNGWQVTLDQLVERYKQVRKPKHERSARSAVNYYMSNIMHSFIQVANEPNDIVIYRIAERGRGNKAKFVVVRVKDKLEKAE